MRTVRNHLPTSVDLSEFSTENLLDAMVRLTHTIHGTTDEERKNALRAQRSLAREEVLRRCDPLRFEE